MAESSMAAGALQDLVDDISNNVTNLMANFNLLRNAFNVSLETADGHDHDDVSSKISYSGINNWTLEEFFLANANGVFRTGGGF